MATVFDYVTVACFLGMAGAFFILTAREPRTLLHLLVVGIAFAIANQVGNAGYTVLAVVLIIAGVAYAAMIIRQNNPSS
jgi:nitrate/nitrite transporter NarK